jgi:imidazolonepropionase-like amidohydrolase
MRLYRAGALLTAASAGIIRNGGVLVEGSSIVAAGPLEALGAAQADQTEVIDLGELTLMPGLVDAHVHLGFDGGPAPVDRMKAESDAEQLILMLHSARELLHAGVTTARDLGARSFLDVAVRDAVARGIADGPRLITAARPLTPTGGHCWFMGGECDTADELRRMVRLHHKMGADVIKVMSTGGFMTEGSAPWFAQFSPAELSAVVAESHRLGKRVAAHAHGREGIAGAVAARVDTIEHCSFAGEDGKYGSDFDPALAEEIAAAGIYVCPTMNVHARTLRDRFGDALEKVITGLHSRGVQIIAGTDSGINNCPHGGYVCGLEALVEAGLPTVEVLDAATLRAARALGVDDRTGSITAGKDADIVAVRGDPRQDISALHRVELVVARGTQYVPAPQPAWLGTGPAGNGAPPPGAHAWLDELHAGLAEAGAGTAGPGLGMAEAHAGLAQADAGPAGPARRDRR